MSGTIGQNIRTLRKERNLTQEAIAAKIGVTPQAISKWEKETGLPDIRQIVPLANAFGVSTDMLLGVEMSNDEGKKALDYIQSLRADIKDGDEDALIVLFEDLVNCPEEYDYDTEMLMTRLTLGVQILCMSHIKLTAKEKRNMRAEIEKNANCLIRYSTNVAKIQEARSWLLRMYTMLGDYDKAREMVAEFPEDASLTFGAMAAWVDRMEGDTQAEIVHREQNIAQYLGMIANEMVPLGNALGRLGRDEAATAVYQTMLDLIKAIYKDEEFTPPLHKEPEILYYHLARMALKADDSDLAIHYLEVLYEYEKSNKAYFNVKQSPDTPVLHDLTFNYPDKEYSVKEHMESILGRAPLKPLRSLRRFKKLLEQVENEK